MYLLRIKQAFCAAFALVSFVFTLYTLVKFILFTSKPVEQQRFAENSLQLKTATRQLVNNTIWLVVFILQHSFQKHENVKKLWEKIGLRAIERSAYNLLSSFFLLQLVQNWTFVEKWTLWSFSVQMHSTIWWILISVHSVLWAIIAFGSLLMDLPELFGVKQIYYDIQGLKEPLLYKAHSLRRLISNIRHPSYVGFSLIFWITNLMSLDRFILSLFLSVYMFLAWSPSREDYTYQHKQLEIKKLEIRYDLKQT